MRTPMILILFSLLTPALSQAESLPDLSSHFNEIIENADHAFSTQSSSQQACDWEFKAFYLNIAPHISFGISGVLDLTISPDIVLIWEKVGPH
ncbi:hypothetical protein WDW86_11475 [Bdellovibrionota bacterium FG-2]